MDGIERREQLLVWEVEPPASSRPRLPRASSVTARSTEGGVGEEQWTQSPSLSSKPCLPHPGWGLDIPALASPSPAPPASACHTPTLITRNLLDPNFFPAPNPPVLSIPCGAYTKVSGSPRPGLQKRESGNATLPSPGSQLHFSGSAEKQPIFVSQALVPVTRELRGPGYLIRGSAGRLA